MASVSVCRFGRPVGFHGPISRAEFPATTLHRLGGQAPPTPSSFRFENAVKLQIRPRLLTVFASNNNPSGGDSLKEKSDGIKTGEDASGPPLLTVLAGFLVFFIICWIIGSIVMWLIGLIVKVTPS